MKFALSTNWCNRRLESGEAIVEEALSLGFDALELGFRTSVEQVAGFKARLDEMPVGSVHAFCPVPISAPQGHPELFTLASFDSAARALARAHVANNVRFAADIGADGKEGGDDVDERLHPQLQRVLHQVGDVAEGQGQHAEAEAAPASVAQLPHPQAHHSGTEHNME